MTFITTAASTTRRAATAGFLFDRVTGTLGYDLDVRGLPGSKLQAVVLIRRDAAGRGRVIQRLSGPDVASESGVVSLGAADRVALLDGRLYLSLVTGDQAPVQARLVIPK